MVSGPHRVGSFDIHDVAVEPADEFLQLPTQARTPDALPGFRFEKCAMRGTYKQSFVGRHKTIRFEVKRMLLMRAYIGIGVDLTLLTHHEAPERPFPAADREFQRAGVR